MKIRNFAFQSVMCGSKELQFKGVLPCRRGCEGSQDDEHKEVERGRKGKFRRRVLASGLGESATMQSMPKPKLREL